MSSRGQGTRCALLLGAALCCGLVGCQPELNRPVPVDKHETCVTSDQCPRGEVCKEGLCIIGQCVVREDCPKPADQLCDELNHCIPDPESPIGNQCPDGDQDCDMGEFCSAGTCYAVADSTPCVRPTDCDAGERCDPVNNFCVEDRGGCNRANEYPELACIEGELCNASTGHCEPLGGAECENAEEDCPPELLCINSRCVQCTSNENCGEGDSVCCAGTGTQCNVATGRCVSAFMCSTHEDCTKCEERPALGDQPYCSDGRPCTGDGDCAHLSSRRCATSTGECIQPECLSDSDCSGSWECDLATWRCYLPPAVCQEAAEPNNSLDAATPIGSSPYTDVLCRGDVDFLRFEGQVDTWLRVTVEILQYYEAGGIGAALLDSAGAVIDADTFTGWDDHVRLQSELLVANAPHYLRLQGGAVSRDTYTYTVMVEALAPLQCDDEPGEPNNSFADAANSVLAAGEHTLALCGENDVDFHQLVALAGLRLMVTATFDDDDGDLDLELLSTAGADLDSSDGYTDTETVAYIAGESDETVVLRVGRSLYADSADQQAYTLAISHQEPPSCDDGHEPNESIEQASSITAGTYQASICSPDDEDYYAVSLPGGGDLTATITFDDDDGDIDLYLYDADDEQLDYSMGSSDSETVADTALDPGTYYVRVHPWSNYLEAQPYTLVLDVNHYCLEDHLEQGGNDTLDRATRLRDSALESFLLEEDLKLCGAGDDWYRLLLLGDEMLEVELTGPSGVAAELFVQGEEGAVPVAAGRELLSSEELSESYLGYHVPGRGALYYLRVAGGGVDERGYHLRIAAFIDACAEDAREFDDTRGFATVVRAPGLSGDGLLCPARDTDGFLVPLLAGTEVDVAVSFDATVADLDLAPALADSAVNYAPRADSGGPAVEGFHHVASAPGELYIGLVRRPGSPTAPLPYHVSIEIAGGPVEDGGVVDEDGGGPDEDGGGEDGAGQDEDGGTADGGAEDGAAAPGADGGA